MGLSHVPHTCKHVQRAQYMQTHPAATALHTATDKQQNLTISHVLGACHLYPVATGSLPTAQRVIYKKFKFLIHALCSFELKQV